MLLAGAFKQAMVKVRVEITGRNDYWFNAIFVEWDDQFPDRKLEHLNDRYYKIDPEWLPDLQRVAQQCFGQAVLAPDDPGRRQLFRRLIGG